MNNKDIITQKIKLTKEENRSKELEIELAKIQIPLRLKEVELELAKIQIPLRLKELELELAKIQANKT